MNRMLNNISKIAEKGHLSAERVFRRYFPKILNTNILLAFQSFGHIVQSAEHLPQPRVCNRKGTKRGKKSNGINRESEY